MAEYPAACRRKLVLRSITVGQVGQHLGLSLLVGRGTKAVTATTADDHAIAIITAGARAAPGAVQSCAARPLLILKGLLEQTDRGRDVTWS